MSADINHSFYTGRMVKDVEAKSINNSYLITGSFFYVNHLKKGTQISIEGMMVQERWEKDGQKQSAYILYADKIIPAWGSKDSGSNSSNGSSVPSFNSNEGFPEDCPF